MILFKTLLYRSSLSLLSPLLSLSLLLLPSSLFFSSSSFPSCFARSLLILFFVHFLAFYLISRYPICIPFYLIYICIAYFLRSIGGSLFLEFSIFKLFHPFFFIYKYIYSVLFLFTHKSSLFLSSLVLRCSY